MPGPAADHARCSPRPPPEAAGWQNNGRRPVARTPQPGVNAGPNTAYGGKDRERSYIIRFTGHARRSSRFTAAGENAAPEIRRRRSTSEPRVAKRTLGRVDA